MESEESLDMFEVEHVGDVDPWQAVLPAPRADGVSDGAPDATSSGVPSQRDPRYVRLRDEHGRSLGVLLGVSASSDDLTSVVLAPRAKLDPKPATHARVSVEPATEAEFAAYSRQVRRRDRVLPLTALTLLALALVWQVVLDVGLGSSWEGTGWFVVAQVLKYVALVVGVVGLVAASAGAWD